MFPDRSFARTPRSDLPNGLTTIGLASSVAWLMGASWAWAAVSIVADELDGYTARLTGQTSTFGAAFDRTTDVALAGAVAMRLRAPWLLIPAVPLSAYAHDDEWPVLGSTRAFMTIAALMLGR